MHGVFLVYITENCWPFLFVWFSLVFDNCIRFLNFGSLWQRSFCHRSMWLLRPHCFSTGLRICSYVYTWFLALIQLPRLYLLKATRYTVTVNCISWRQIHLGWIVKVFRWKLPLINLLADLNLNTHPEDKFHILCIAWNGCVHVLEPWTIKRHSAVVDGL